jgi:hypothetical protein
LSILESRVGDNAGGHLDSSDAVETAPVAIDDALIESDLPLDEEGMSEAAAASTASAPNAGSTRCVCVCAFTFTGERRYGLNVGIGDIRVVEFSKA